MLSGNSKTFYVLTLLFLVLPKSTVLLGQCPNNQWDVANIGSAYVESLGNKAIYGNFTNKLDAQYVNDGKLYFFGDITNEGHLGDGFGYEFIKTCDSLITTISGEGSTEFNILDINNTGDIDLDTDIRIKTNLNFTNGIVHTDRNEFRERIFFIEGATYSGANDQRHVDGTVARQGQGSFIFPVGDGDHLSPLKIRGENPFDIFISTYHSTLQFDDQYVSRGTFPTNFKAFNVLSVQPKEFWTLSGGQSTRVTLFWTAFSEINELAPSVNDLVVVGWDGEKWVNLGNTELVQTFNTGTVTSSSIIPNRYDAFTFGVLDTDGDRYADSQDPEPEDPCIPDPSSEACQNRTCIEVAVSVFMEGPLHNGAIGQYADEMKSRLNQYGYLPGQRPTTLLGVATDAGQPYDKEPWFYAGDEGKEFNAYESNSEVYPRAAIDWVLVSLRTRTNAASTVCKKPGLLMSDGEIVFTEFFDCCNMTNEEYYIVVEHRNHLPVMSPTPMPVVDGLLQFDFRTTNSYVRLLGNGQKEIKPGVFAMYAGNGDQILAPESPKDINSNDISLWARDNGKNSGYYFQDYDLNGDVNVHDKAIWLLNNGVFTDVDR